jgi:PAS domain S-box-containing protein
MMTINLRNSTGEEVPVYLVRDVNRLLFPDKDPGIVLKEICDILITHRSYASVLICSVNGLKKVTSCFFSRNVDENAAEVATQVRKKHVTFGDMIADIKKNDCSGIINIAMEQKGVIRLRMPLNESGATFSPDGEVIMIQIGYRDKVYGVLAVEMTGITASPAREMNLIEDIAGAIAVGMYHHESEKEHLRVQATLKERIKELNYIFSLSRLVENADSSLDVILKEAVELLPSAMILPELVCAELILGRKRFETKNFQETRLKFSTKIFVNKKVAGILQIGYSGITQNNAHLFYYDKRDLVNSVARRLGKIIERKNDRKALEQSERILSDLVNNSHTCIAILQNKKIVYQNPEHKKLFGEMDDASEFPSVELIHPEDKSDIQKAFSNFYEGKGSAPNIEFRIFPPGDNQLRDKMKWVHCRASMILHQGKDAFLINLMDITKSKELENLLRIEDKMTSLGRVTAGIAHEIRNPLSGINIYLKTLEKKISRDGLVNENIEKILGQIQSASNKIESIIRRVMDFSKPCEPDFVLENVNRPIEDALNLSALTLQKSGIQLSNCLCQELPNYKIDPPLIEQVIINLISNAAEALKTVTGLKKISLSSTIENDAICIRVSDSGPGILQGSMGNIFDPFYTTRQNSPGIGLSICHRIITDHGGRLKVSRSCWGGAEFKIELPVSGVEAAA